MAASEFPRAAGYADYSSIGTTQFIPQVWSGKLVQKFYATTVFGSIASTDYEGEIKGMGDNIIIRTVPTITVSDYQIGSTFGPTDYDVPSRNSVDLAINKGKKFLVRVNTVDRVQSDLDLVDVFSDEASMQLKIAMDRDLLANAPQLAEAVTNKGNTAGVISANLLLGVTGTPFSITTATVATFLTALGQAMDEQNVSDEGRWVILPAWCIKKLKLSPLNQAYLTGDSVSILRNGKVGMVDRFTIYQSNLLATGTAAGLAAGEVSVMAGHTAGLAWASQIVEMERITNPWDFGHLLRGLCVYGYQVVEPKYIFQGIISEGVG